ncbi:MAG: ROK family protein [Acidimicrobiales bacterium]|nr:ROK family protein [Acidimicrobiales bacterium]
MTWCLAADIGGTKLASALVDERGCLRARHQRPTPGEADPEQLLEAVVTLVEEAASEAPAGAEIEVCGVGCGGPMSPGGDAVSPLNIPAWRGFPLRSRLSGATGLPTFVDNDAKALALAEGWLGAAAGRRDYLAMVVSTGVGGGIVVDGRLLDGRAGNAGHIGHVIVVPGGSPCRCGGTGCLEAEASGPAIARRTGRPPELAPLEEVGRAGCLVGRGIASVANLLDLDLAVVGGSVALGFGAPFFDAAQSEVEKLCRLDHSRGTRVVPLGLGADGPLVGAAAVGWRGLGRWAGGR